MNLVIYRYLSTHALETLQNKELMVAKPSSLNDPFEFMFKTPMELSLSDARSYFKSKRKSDDFMETIQKNNPNINSRKKLKKFVDDNFDQMANIYQANFSSLMREQKESAALEADKSYRICSFSSSDVDPESEVLLWSHYADKHHGVRIKFEIPPDSNEFYIRKIKYQSERVLFDFVKNSSEALMTEAMIETITTKSKAWIYEKEYRLFTITRFCKFAKCPDGKIRTFLKFNPIWVTGLDFGLRCARNDYNSIKNILSNHYPWVTTRQARVHDSDFKLVYEECV